MEFSRNSLIQAFMVVRVTYKIEVDPIKNKASRVVAKFLPLKGVGFFKTLKGSSKVIGRILLNFETIRDVMIVLITCKSQEDPSKLKALELHYKSNFQRLKGS